jgi:hypothetical protein
MLGTYGAFNTFNRYPLTNGIELFFFIQANKNGDAGFLPLISQFFYFPPFCHSIPINALYITLFAFFYIDRVSLHLMIDCCGHRVFTVQLADARRICEVLRDILGPSHKKESSLKILSSGI